MSMDLSFLDDEQLLSQQTKLKIIGICAIAAGAVYVLFPDLVFGPIDDLIVMIGTSAFGGSRIRKIRKITKLLNSRKKEQQIEDIKESHYVISQPEQTQYIPSTSQEIPIVNHSSPVGIQQTVQTKDRTSVANERINTIINLVEQKGFTKEDLSSLGYSDAEINYALTLVNN